MPAVISPPAALAGLFFLSFDALATFDLSIYLLTTTTRLPSSVRTISTVLLGVCLAGGA